MWWLRQLRPDTAKAALTDRGFTLLLSVTENFERVGPG